MELTMGYITAPNQEVAKNLAHQLITNKLAACANIVPQILSIYAWEGEIQEDNETLLLIKTTVAKQKAIINFVKTHHPYACPAIIFYNANGGLEDYLDWVKNQLSVE